MGDVPITAELVAGLVAEQFPEWGNLPVRPVEADGWDNRTFRLGEHLSVRLPSAAAYAAQVERERRWLPVLARGLPVPIPEVLARGEPCRAFPRPWSVRRWLDGDPVGADSTVSRVELAGDLARFLAALHRIDPTGGPAAGVQNFHRGGSLLEYDEQTRQVLGVLPDRQAVAAATRVWQDALSSRWDDDPVWVHGDVTGSNLLTSGGRLAAVIDFGSCGVGDPACDLSMAWTTFSGQSREVFCSGVGLDDRTWARARGWALWKALVTLAEGASAAEASRRRFGWRWPVAQVVDRVLGLEDR